MTTDELAQVRARCVKARDNLYLLASYPPVIAAYGTALPIGADLLVRASLDDVPALLIHIATLEAERDAAIRSLNRQEGFNRELVDQADRMSAELRNSGAERDEAVARNEAMAAVVAAARGLRRLPLFNLGRPWGAGEPEYAALAEAQDRLDAALNAQAGEVMG